MSMVTKGITVFKLHFQEGKVAGKNIIYNLRKLN